MKRFLEEMRDRLERVEKGGLLIPNRIEPPAKEGTEDLGELPEDLQRLYTLIELLLAERKQVWLSGDSKKENPRLKELELQGQAAANVFRLRFQQKYGDDDHVSLYSDWHVYRIR